MMNDYEYDCKILPKSKSQAPYQVYPGRPIRRKVKRRMEENMSFALFVKEKWRQNRETERRRVKLEATGAN